MKKYIELKVRTRDLFIFGVFIFIVCSIGGYYFWCSFHPEVRIKISDGPTGKEGIKMEAPHISILPTGIAAPSASIELKANSIIMQHAFFCSYVKDTYETSDIKLDMEIHGDDTTLIYSGTATTEDGERHNVEKEVNCGFTLNANIIDGM